MFWSDYRNLYTKKTTNVQQKKHRFRALLTALDLSRHHLSSAGKKAHLGNVEKKEAWSRNKTIGAKRKENSFGQTTALGTERKKIALHCWAVFDFREERVRLNHFVNILNFTAQKHYCCPRSEFG